MERVVWVQPELGRAGLGRARLLPGGPPHPQFRRALGPHAAAGAAGDHRPREGERGTAGHGPGAGRARLRARSERRKNPARRPHPPRQPAHARNRAEPDPAPRLQLLEGRHPGRPARHGPRLHLLPVEPQGRLHGHPEPPQRRAPRGIRQSPSAAAFSSFCPASPTRTTFWARRSSPRPPSCSVPGCGGVDRS